MFSTQNPPYMLTNTGQAMSNGDVVSSAIRSIVPDYTKLYKKFVNERLIKCSVPLTDKISRNNIMLAAKAVTTSELTLTAPLGSDAEDMDRKLVQNLKTAAQFRKSGVIDALRYEPKNAPLAFTVKGKMYQTNKATILSKLKVLATPAQLVEPVDSITVTPEERKCQLLVDLSMIVTTRQYKTLASSVARFFDEAKQDIVVIPGKFERIDLIGDNYVDRHRLKDNTSSSRGLGTVVESVTINANGALPSNFYNIFAEYAVTNFDPDVVVVVTRGREVLSNCANIMLPSCSSHLEADFRLVTHIVDGVRSGYINFKVRANDTDIIMILTAFYPTFLTLNSDFHLLI